LERDNADGKGHSKARATVTSGRGVGVVEGKKKGRREEEMRAEIGKERPRRMRKRGRRGSDESKANIQRKG